MVKDITKSHVNIYLTWFIIMVLYDFHVLVYFFNLTQKYFSRMTQTLFHL